MSNPALTSIPASHASPDAAEASAPAMAGCPAWCAVRPDSDTEGRHVAHRAAIWELPDRVEICVMQVISDDPTDIVLTNVPTLYFWSADDARLTDAECVEMACAIRRTADVLCGLSGVSPLSEQLFESRRDRLRTTSGSN